MIPCIIALQSLQDFSRADCLHFVGRSGWKSWWYGHSLFVVSNFFPGSTWSMYHNPSIAGMAENRIRHPKLAHCCCLMCQRNHKSDLWKVQRNQGLNHPSSAEDTMMYCSAEMSDHARCCSMRRDRCRRNIFDLNSCTCAFSVYWDSEWACIAGSYTFGILRGHWLWQWTLCACWWCLGSTWLLFRNDEVFVTCVSWVISFVFSMGKQANDREILYALRTIDTSILSDSVYREKDNVSLVNVDIDLISTGGGHQSNIFH